MLNISNIVQIEFFLLLELNYESAKLFYPPVLEKIKTYFSALNC